MMATRAGACLVGLALAGPLVAQEPAETADTAVYPLPPLQVSVTRGTLAPDRVPLAISMVRSVDLHVAAPGVDLHEMLRGVPGVLVSNRYNLALDTRISVRGFGARSAFGVRGVRMVLDGIPLTLPDGQSMLTNVDVGALGSAEVIRGPAAALYGNAAGGVISLTTAEPHADGLVEATATAGSYGTSDPTNLLRVQGNVGGRGANDSWVVGLSHLSLDGYREHSRAERTGLNGRYRRALGPSSSISAVINVAAVPVALNPGSLPADSAARDPRMAWPQNVVTGSGKDVSQAQGGVSYRHGVEGAEIEAALYGQGRRMDNPLPFGRYIRLHRDAAGARVEARAAADRPTSWSLGVEAQSQRDDRLERDNDGGQMTGATYQDRVDRVLSVAPFGFVQATAAPGVALRAGARYDAVVFDSEDRLDAAPAEGQTARRTLDALSGSVGALVELGAGIRGWTSLSSWFQTPTSTELINVPPAPGETCCQTGFNPDLEPQDGWGLEAGVAGTARGLSWEVVGYELRARNEILPFQVEGVPGREFFRNAGGAVHRGIEATAEMILGRGWFSGLSYTLSDFRFRAPVDPALEGKRIPGVPPHRLDARVRWRRGGTSLAAEGEWVDAFPADDANTEFAPAYLVVDLRAAHQLSTTGARLEPFAAVTNLLDSRYSASVVVNAFGGRYFEPAPGRALLVGLRARFR